MSEIYGSLSRPEAPTYGAPGQEGEPEPISPETGGVGGTTWVVVGVMILLLVVGGGAVYFLGQPSPQPEQSTFKVSLDSAKVVSASNMQIDLNVTLGLHNSAQHEVAFEGALYSLSANGNPLYSGYISQRATVGAGSSTELPSTISINLSDNPAFSNMGTSFSWRMTGRASLSSSGGNSTIPFDFNFKTA